MHIQSRLGQNIRFLSSSHLFYSNFDRIISEICLPILSDFHEALETLSYHTNVWQHPWYGQKEKGSYSARPMYYSNMHRSMQAPCSQDMNQQLKTTEEPTTATTDHVYAINARRNEIFQVLNHKLGFLWRLLEFF